MALLKAGVASRKPPAEILPHRGALPDGLHCPRQVTRQHQDVQEVQLDPGLYQACPPLSRRGLGFAFAARTSLCL